MKKRIAALFVCFLMVVSIFAGTAFAAANDQQIVSAGGASPADGLNADGVAVSKTLEGTDLENYFDITLSITTTTELKTLVEKQNCAVVIVLDQSRTMNTDNRLVEAKTAAKEFIDSYCVVDGSIKVNNLLGFVVFDTDATTLFDVGAPSSASITSWKKKIDNIKTEAYDSVERYTNIEAGLQLGYNLLKDVDAVSKHIILLTDGFPTTYIRTDRDSKIEIQGYNPEASVGKIGDDGYFYDAIKKQTCWGTSYSDKAAAKAQAKAAEIKATGITIFSVGIDIGGQTVQTYVNQSAPVVDRTGTEYVIGSATDKSAYKNWLRTSIGSNSYCDGDDLSALKSAYSTIVTDIERLYTTAVSETWFASDPMGTNVEFQYFFDKDGATAGKSLSGSNTEGGEDTASYSNKISWDLKNSGFTKKVEGNKTYYTYSIKYRVRLTNEANGFVEEQAYSTNGTTTLKYKVVNDGVLSGEKSIDFPIPSVKGYLGDISFTKVGKDDVPLAGAVFTLSHACGNCGIRIADRTATSDANGFVEFNGIPSAHTYTLKETTAPEGYVLSETTYPVSISYGVVSFDKDGGTITNSPIEPDPTPTPTPTPTPEVTPTPTPEVTPTPTPEVTPTPTPVVTPTPTPWVPIIPSWTPTPTPTPTPTTTLPGEEIIEDEEVPLAGPPNTGDHDSSLLGIVITAAMVLTVGAVLLYQRRRAR